MLSADIVIADDSTKFVAAYQGIGFTPDCGLSWLLPRAVGQPRALDFLLSGRSLSASEAQEWGLVSRLAGDGTAIEAARRLAQELASGPKPALGWTRRLARQSWECSRSVTGREEARTIALASGTTDSIVRLEGFSAR
jgi:2-(1,2-epoxy-1,2-dihydrophenyl)acetyl-CoA isomerase